MLSPRSKKFHEAEKLRNDFQSYFGGKYSAARSSSKHIGIADVWKLMFSSKNKLLILLGSIILLVMFLLVRSKPKFIMQKRRSYDERDKVSIYYLFLYSVIIGLFVSAVVSVLVYRSEKLRKYLFNGECGLCME